LHAKGAVGERLRNCHFAPLAITIGPELRDASFQVFQVVRRKQVFHAEILREHAGNNRRNRNGELSESARRFGW
jgi:hypothetical protein